MHNLEEYMQRMLTSGRLSHLLPVKLFGHCFFFLFFSLIYLDNCHVLLNVLFFKFLNELRVILILKALDFFVYMDGFDIYTKIHFTT